VADLQPLLERIREATPLIADGAMGTMLLDRGLEPGAPPERMTLERPEVLRDVAAAYLAAGADIVETNTFGASRLKLQSAGLGADIERCNRDAVGIVRDVVGQRAYVAGSVGPCGRLLEPYGDVAPAEVRASFDEQCEHLIAAGVDCIFVETMIDIEEAVLAVEAAKSTSPDIPVAAMLTFDPTPRGFYTIMGNSVEVAAQRLAAAGADLAGSNCGNGMEHMIDIARAFRAQSALPLIIQANAGLPTSRDGAVVYPEGPEPYARGARALRDVPVAVIGGCCGTTPDHVRALRRLVIDDLS
jgi:5-methyltetrahydrofolate--homocysteine methyltransferase